MLLGEQGSKMKKMNSRLLDKAFYSPSVGNGDACRGS